MRNGRRGKGACPGPKRPFLGRAGGDVTRAMARKPIMSLLMPSFEKKNGIGRKTGDMARMAIGPVILMRERMNGTKPVKAA